MGSCLFNNVSFLSYFLTLMPSVNGWSVNLVIMSVFILCELGLNYIYIIYIYIMYIYIYMKVTHPTIDMGLPISKSILVI